MFQSLENVFLHLCRDDQIRNNQQNTINRSVQENLNDPTGDIETPPISPGEFPNGEIPHSGIRKKELVKTRMFILEKGSTNDRDILPSLQLYYVQDERQLIAVFVHICIKSMH